MICNFHGTYTIEDKKIFQLAQEKDLVRICDYLKTDIGKLNQAKIEVFDSREGKQNADPHHSISRASARFGDMTIYRYWIPSDDVHFPHETTHLVAHTWAKPYSWEVELDTWDNKKLRKNLEMVSTSFMQEGLAIAVDDIVFGRKLLEEGELKFIDDWCREQRGQMPKSLVGVINLDGFGSLPNRIVVPFSASFSKYLLQTFGVDKYREMYVALREINTPEENVEAIERIYQQQENELFGGWWATQGSNLEPDVYKTSALPLS